MSEQQNSTIIDIALKFVQESIEELDDNEIPLSHKIRKSIRIATLLSDYDNLLWLRHEMINFSDDSARERIKDEIISHYAPEDLKNVLVKFIQAYVDERQSVTVDVYGNIREEKKVCISSAPEIEESIHTLTAEKDDIIPLEGLSTQEIGIIKTQSGKMRTILRVNIKQSNDILQRIKQRLFDFLNEKEKELLHGRMGSDIFEKNREYVDNRLKEIAPDALEKFKSAYERLRGLNAESGSHALLSCRRILKSLADALYPHTDKVIKGPDGKERKMSEDKYKNRLWQFVTDKVKVSKARDLLLTNIEDLGNKIDKIYDLSSKGVHAEVKDSEINQCFIQTYLLVGDLLRLADEKSALTIDEDN